jgi:hypothetical protein
MGAKDDASTDIEKRTKSFMADMTKACAKLREARLVANESEKSGDKKSADPPVITFAFDPNQVTKFRTPAEQARELVDGNTDVCWSSHMADKARHVIMKADGKLTWKPKPTMGKDFDAFKKAWATAMRSNGLKNAKGTDGWYDRDAFHFELPASKLRKSDERAKACLQEYVRLTREAGEEKNETFEDKHPRELAPFLKKYEEH